MFRYTHPIVDAFYSDAGIQEEKALTSFSVAHIMRYEFDNFIVFDPAGVAVV